MANGTIHKLGTLYVNNAKRPFPTKPWRTDSTPTGAPSAGNILNYDSVKGNIEIRNTDSDDAYKLRWVEVNDGAKKLLISDRCLLARVTWDELNAQGLISGKEITIDGQKYKIRLLSGGTNYRSGSDSYSGGYPTTNEWDRIITNESSFAGLPKPTSTDLDSTLNSTDYNGSHNNIWHWHGIYSWCQEVYSGNSGFRVFRGCYSARYFSSGTRGSRDYYLGWRPALEVLNSAPTINGADGNLGDYVSPLIKQYTIFDSDNDKLSVTEKLDGVTIKSLTNQNSGTSITLDLTSKWAGLSLGNHTVTITVDDGNGASATRTWTFAKTNSAPDKPTMLYPKTNMRTKESFHVRFTINPDAEGDPQAVKIQIADNSAFNSNLKEFSSGLEKNVDGSWVAHVGNISNAYVGNEFRISVSADKNTTKYIRVVTTDQTSNVSVYGDYQTIKIGDILQIETIPQSVDFKPYAISLTDKKVIDSEATVRVYACNNAHDEVKSWEEITSQYLSGNYYTFKNNSKLSDYWAVSVKYVIEANNSVGEISIDAIGIGVS